MSSKAIARAVATRSSAVENLDGAAVTIPIGPGKDEHYCFTAGDYDEYGVLHRQRYAGYVRKVVTPTSTRNVAHAKVYVVCDGDAEGLELPLPLIDFVLGLRRGCGDGVDVGGRRQSYSRANERVLDRAPNVCSISISWHAAALLRQLMSTCQLCRPAVISCGTLGTS